MIYNQPEIGANVILNHQVIGIDDPVFLGVFKVPCFRTGKSKNALIPSAECEDYYNFTITGVAEAYQDLLNGEIFFSNLGTWDVDLYFQTSTTNTDPVNATFLETFQLQVNGGS